MRSNTDDGNDDDDDVAVDDDDDIIVDDGNDDDDDDDDDDVLNLDLKRLPLTNRGRANPSSSLSLLSLLSSSSLNL